MPRRRGLRQERCRRPGMSPGPRPVQGPEGPSGEGLDDGSARAGADPTGLAPAREPRRWPLRRPRASLPREPGPPRSQPLRGRSAGRRGATATRRPVVGTLPPCTDRPRSRRGIGRNIAADLPRRVGSRSSARVAGLRATTPPATFLASAPLVSWSPPGARARTRRAPTRASGHPMVRWKAGVGRCRVHPAHRAGHRPQRRTGGRTGRSPPTSTRHSGPPGRITRSRTPVGSASGAGDAAGHVGPLSVRATRPDAERSAPIGAERIRTGGTARLPGGRRPTGRGRCHTERNAPALVTSVGIAARLLPRTPARAARSPRGRHASGRV